MCGGRRAIPQMTMPKYMIQMNRPLFTRNSVAMKMAPTPTARPVTRRWPTLRTQTYEGHAPADTKKCVTVLFQPPPPPRRSCRRRKPKVSVHVCVCVCVCVCARDQGTTEQHRAFQTFLNWWVCGRSSLRHNRKGSIVLGGCTHTRTLKSHFFGLKIPILLEFCDFSRKVVGAPNCVHCLLRPAACVAIC